MYDGYKAPIGFIWSEQEEGMVPLYNRWSDSRNDTRTQVGYQFESMYNGGMNRLGFIYKQDKGGMVPLYNRWSGSRNDTRSQVGNQFEPMYNGGMNLLGYIRPVGKIVVRSMDYPTLKSSRPDEIPTFVLEQRYINNTTVDQSGEITYAFESRNEYIFSWNNAITVGLELSAIAKIPEIVELKVTATVENKITFGETKSKKQAERLESNYLLRVPPKSTATLHARLLEATLDLPFEAKLGLLQPDGSIREWVEKGTYKNIKSTKSKVEVA